MVRGLGHTTPAIGPQELLLRPKRGGVNMQRYGRMGKVGGKIHLYQRLAQIRLVETYHPSSSKLNICTPAYREKTFDSCKFVQTSNN